MNLGPTFEQIRALVEQLRKNASEAKTFGLYSPGRYGESRRHEAGNDVYSVAQCDSLLAMRAELQNRESDVTVQVLVTPVKDDQVGDDLRVRLAKRRLHPLKVWDIVKAQLQVRLLDSRIAREAWMAEMLYRVVSGPDCPKVASGVLDAETAWGLLLSSQLGLEEAQPDLVALLTWSMEQTNADRFRSADPAFGTAASDWLVQSAGLAVPAVLGCVRASMQPDALPVGLALGVIFHDAAGGQLDRAAGRIEQYCGGLTLDRDAALRWSAAAAEAVRLRLTDATKRHGWLERTDELLRTVGAESWAYLSDLSPLGLQQRLTRFARCLTAAIGHPLPSISPELRKMASEVRRHWLADADPRRVERMKMALRLLRWLAGRKSTAEKNPASFAAAVRDYTAEGSFVDRARHVLRAGEAIPELANAYAELTARITVEREEQNRSFGALLRDALAAGSFPEDIPGIEHVLGRVAAPLAASAPILFLVLDGMSMAVFLELLDDLAQTGWVPLSPEKGPLIAALAALPSITAASRTSLLCGILRTGQAADEKAAFARHPALLAAYRKGLPPVLFHKAELHGQGEASLPAEMRQTIADPKQRVVGVVINAVDDQLPHGEQTDPRWGRGFIKALPPLLHEARAGGRLLVLVSDHGHVLDQGTEQSPGDGGERWRNDDGNPSPGEVQLAGPRVLIGGGRIIVPWSERVRYVGKKNGYHGGAAPQEVVVPLAVLSPGSLAPAGWEESPVCMPDWWEGTPEVSAPPLSVHRRKQAEMFEVQQEQTAPRTWINVLLESEPYRAQRRLAGRNPPSDDLVRNLLTALDAHGGKLSDIALASRLGVPLSRLASTLAPVRRLLNAEGFSVLSRDESSGTVELNRNLMARLFQLSGEDQSS